MLNLVLTGGSALVVPGVPKYFFSDKDLITILKNPSMVVQLQKLLGEGVSIGRLGRLGDDGIYYEESDVQKVDAVQSNEGLGYYARV